ncbi:hypothetical protein CDL12_20386 [Handroanthus impetiginosus]|uniref:Uncharacterized protein n=1 Tax=Handroanthus impetiginosus TaxID=429701 RepID=A0A2G9GP78_9LAMI|nr:hypothetical protein CDL12_20386 [Handroanthus impetiginosus]
MPDPLFGYLFFPFPFLFWTHIWNINIFPLVSFSVPAYSNSLLIHAIGDGSTSTAEIRRHTREILLEFSVFSSQVLRAELPVCGISNRNLDW